MAGGERQPQYKYKNFIKKIPRSAFEAERRTKKEHSK